MIDIRHNNVVEIVGSITENCIEPIYFIKDEDSEDIYFAIEENLIPYDKHYWDKKGE